MGELFGSHGQRLTHEDYLHRLVGPEVVLGEFGKTDAFG
jgi:hypothetical protein